MRVCYLVPGALSRHAPDEAARRGAYLRDHVAAGVDVELRDNPDGPACVESAEQERAAAAGLQPLLPRLEGEGFDAIIIGCFGDPGLEAARARVSIPVVGPARASMRHATSDVDRFAILTVVDGVVPSLCRLAHDYGVGESLAGVWAVNVPVLELRDRREEVRRRLASTGREALDAGAEALVLGCMTMGFLDVAPRLEDELGVAVINPVLASLRAAAA